MDLFRFLFPLIHLHSLHSPIDSLDEVDQDLANISFAHHLFAEKWRTLYSRLRDVGNELSLPAPCDVLGLNHLVKDILLFLYSVELLENNVDKANINLTCVFPTFPLHTLRTIFVWNLQCQI